jgi:hypothetical protein
MKKNKISKQTRQALGAFKKALRGIIAVGVLNEKESLTITVLDGKTVCGIVSHDLNGAKKMTSKLTKEDFANILALPWTKEEYAIMEIFYSHGNKPVTAVWEMQSFSQGSFNQRFSKYGLPYRLYKSGHTTSSRGYPLQLFKLLRGA